MLVLCAEREAFLSIHFSLLGSCQQLEISICRDAMPAAKKRAVEPVLARRVSAKQSPPDQVSASSPIVQASPGAAVSSPTDMQSSNVERQLIIDNIMKPMGPILEKMSAADVQPVSYGGLQAFNAELYAATMEADGEFKCTCPLHWLGLVPFLAMCLLLLIKCICRNLADSSFKTLAKLGQGHGPRGHLAGVRHGCAGIQAEVCHARDREGGANYLWCQRYSCCFQV